MPPVLQEFWFVGALRFYKEEVSREMWLIKACSGISKICTLYSKGQSNAGMRQALASLAVRKMKKSQVLP